MARGAETAREVRRRRPGSRRGLSGDSPLLGGRLEVAAGAEEPRSRGLPYDARSGELDLPSLPPDPALAGPATCAS
jgi:hypothetical protein